MFYLFILLIFCSCMRKYRWQCRERYGRWFPPFSNRSPTGLFGFPLTRCFSAIPVPSYFAVATRPIGTTSSARLAPCIFVTFFSWSSERECYNSLSVSFWMRPCISIIISIRPSVHLKIQSVWHEIIWHEAHFSLGVIKLGHLTRGNNSFFNAFSSGATHDNAFSRLTSCRWR